MWVFPGAQPTRQRTWVGQRLWLTSSPAFCRPGLCGACGCAAANAPHRAPSAGVQVFKRHLGGCICFSIRAIKLGRLIRTVKFALKFEPGGHDPGGAGPACHGAARPWATRLHEVCRGAAFLRFGPRLERFPPPHGKPDEWSCSSEICLKNSSFSNGSGFHSPLRNPHTPPGWWLGSASSFVQVFLRLLVASSVRVPLSRSWMLDTLRGRS